MDIYLVSIIIFLGLFAGLILKDRKNIEFKGILITRRTKKGRKLIDNIANISPRFWKTIGSIGVLVCFGGMIFGVYFLINTLLAPTGAPSLSIVIPFPSSEATIGYGYIGVPFWYFIIGVLSLVFVHEGMHGILSRAEGIKIKNLGLLLLAVIPGAFVEPDEKQLKKASWKTQIRIYAGGSFSNFLLAGFVFLLLLLVISPVFLMEGVGYLGYVNSTQHEQDPYPAQKLNITDPIIYMNGERISDVEDLSNFMQGTRPGQIVSLQTYNKTYEVILAENPDNPEQGFIGVSGVQQTRMIKSSFVGTPFYGSINFLVEMLNWIFMLNLGVGLVNIFPIKPLDGGLMIESLGKRFFPKYSQGVVRLFAAIFLSLIAGNFLIGFI